MLAKHGKKKIRFHFEDLKFGAFFLDFIRRKKLYSRVTGKLKNTGQLEFSFTGSSDNVRMGIHKLKRLYHKAYEKFLEDETFIELNYYTIDNEIYDEEDLDKKAETDSKDSEINLNLKKLKFNGWYYLSVNRHTFHNTY